MMTLTEINIHSSEGILEFRNKMLILFFELGFNAMECVRLVTKLSDYTRYILMLENSFEVKVAFEKDNSTRKIGIIIADLKIPTDSLEETSLFPNASFVPNKDAATQDIHILWDIPKPRFHIDKNQLETLREKLAVQSKAELTREILHKNEELNKLIAELKNSATLIQSEKMRALGVLTAGVAHELNNPMMGILNFIQYCINKTESNDKRYEVLKDAEKEVLRCIDIVSNLLTFSHLEKEDKATFQPVDMTLLIKRVIRFLSFRLRNEKVNVVENIPAEVALPMGHESRLQQVILNLVTNALDAMKSMMNKELGIKIHSDKENLYITISDTGEGMDEETKNKIFEPFFTTKPTGLGTGLGLSVCESIIKEHHGSITCYSEKNKGTQFYIRLPLS